MSSSRRQALTSAGLQLRGIWWERSLVLAFRYWLHPEREAGGDLGVQMVILFRGVSRGLATPPSPIVKFATTQHGIPRRQVKDVPTPSRRGAGQGCC